MNNIEITFVLLFIFYTIFAIKSEISDFSNILNFVRKEGDINLVPSYIVYWRRSFLISVLLVTSLFYIFSIPFTPRNFLIAFVFNFSILYYQYNFYLYHLYMPIYKSFDCKIKQ
jgi:hypothetical protein